MIRRTIRRAVAFARDPLGLRHPPAPDSWAEPYPGYDADARVGIDGTVPHPTVPGQTTHIENALRLMIVFGWADARARVVMRQAADHIARTEKAYTMLARHAGQSVPIPDDTVGEVVREVLRAHEVYPELTVCQLLARAVFPNGFTGFPVWLTTTTDEELAEGLEKVRRGSAR